MNLVERDHNIIWHPFTQAQTADTPIAVARAEGSYLYDEHGRAYIDLISSWWVNLYGHSHPAIAKSIYEQALKLEHVIFAGFTHEPAVQLCENLQQILAKELKRFFFSDNGSTAVEVALKMAHQYWYNKSEKQRNLFITFEGDYHGDTFGAMAVGKQSGFYDPFKGLLFDVSVISYPMTWMDDGECITKEQAALAELEQVLKLKSDRISAIIFEPLVQGASGMRMCRPEFVRQAVDIVRKYDILVIFDEVMTGFGRTGSYFAYQQIDRTPDFICLSKGITGGSLPLALTVTSERVYQAFLSDNWDKAFAHGHSYTANPLACAAALAAFKLLTADTTIQAMDNINQAHVRGIKSLLNSAHHTKVIRPRIRGTIAAFDVNTDANINLHLKREFINRNLLIRPLGNTVYLLPPYCVTEAELENAYAEIINVLATVD